MCFSYEDSLLAFPLAKLVSGYDAMEVTVLQNIQETLCVGTHIGKSHRTTVPPVDVNHVGTRMFESFFQAFKHRKLCISHWCCSSSLTCLCCPSLSKLQNVLSMYILYVKCVSSLLDLCPVTPVIVSWKGYSAEHSQIPLSTWKCSCKKEDCAVITKWSGEFNRGRS